MPNILRLVAALFVAGLALSACGDGTGNANGDASTQESAPSDDTTAN